MNNLKIKINGIPAAGQPRPRVYFNHGRPHAVSEHGAYYNAVKLQATKIVLKSKINIPEKTPVAVEIICRFALPKSISKKEQERRIQQMYHTQKPDCDNIAKTILDALVASKLIEDDCQVSSLIIGKGWAENNITEIKLAW